MTLKENKAYLKWKKEMDAQGELRNACFSAMQDLCRERGGAPSCSLEGNLGYLLTSNDENTRNRALILYKKYFEASARYSAMMELAQAFADIR